MDSLFPSWQAGFGGLSGGGDKSSSSANAAANVKQGSSNTITVNQGGDDTALYIGATIVGLVAVVLLLRR